jgi:RNA recognition motif-containing protein
LNIFVAKLNYSTTEETLRETFEAFGEVSSAKIIMDRDSKKSKGFGFVEMENDEEAQAAINALDGTELDGRAISVKVAEARESRPKTGGGGFNRRSGGGGGQRSYGDRPPRDRNDRFSGGGGGNRRFS